MPKKLLSILVVTFFVFAVLTQVSHLTVLAQEVPITGPITSPITSPTETPTVTPTPITSPITSFTLTGHIVYRQLGRLLSGMQRVLPAQNVLVTVRGFFNHNLFFQTRTDASGNYSLDLPTGLYTVQASDGINTFFVPPLRVVSIRSRTLKHADFQGLQFRFF